MHLFPSGFLECPKSTLLRAIAENRTEAATGLPAFDRWQLDRFFTKTLQNLS
jgi:hypothetical protein